MKKSAFTKTVEKKLIQSKPQIVKRYLPEHYVTGLGPDKSTLLFTNHTMPSLRSFLRDEFLFTKNNSLSDRFEDFKKLWKESNYFEAKALSLYWLEAQDLKFIVQHAKEFLDWSGQIDNWAHSDSLCNVYARLYEHDRKRTHAQYLKWNKDKRPWLRRCSMVGTFYYSRLRKTQPEFEVVWKLVRPHLHAPEYYVQKGVGWTMREMYNVYPKETTQLIDEHIKDITPIAWVAASEKLPKAVKAKLLNKRR